MDYYYVRDNGVFVGTCGDGGASDNGRELTKRTGAWNTDVTKSYSSIAKVYDKLHTLTHPDVSTIIVASDHIEPTSGAITLGVESVNDYSEMLIISVSVIDYSYLKGASVNASGTINIGSYNSRNNFYTCVGIIFTTTSGSVRLNARDSLPYLLDCTIEEADYNYFGAGIIKNCVITSYYLRSSDTVYEGCTISTSYGGYAFRDMYNSRFYDCDVSGLASNKVYGSTKGIKFFSCKLSADFVSYSLPPVYTTAKDYVKCVGCDSGDGYYKNSAINFNYDVSTAAGVYLNYKYDNVIGASLRIESNSRTNRSVYRRTKLCELPAQDLSVTDTTYRVNLLLDTGTVATLTDTTCWVELSHNDNTSLALGRVVSSRNNDILATGTELTSSAEVWQGTLPTNYKAYQIDITLSAASLPNVTNGSVVIYLNLAVANTDVYACPAVQIGT